MIGKYDKKRKEQKALLKELESIKTLLDDGELISDDFSDLAETAQKKSIEPQPLSASQDKAAGQIASDHNELIFDNDNEDDFLISDELDIDLSKPNKPVTDNKNIPVLEEMVEDTAPPLAVGVLPGQQSLFNDNEQKNSKTDNKPREQAATSSATEPASPVSTRKNTSQKEAIKPSDSAKAQSQSAEQKAKATENPFLPKHIRERLGGAIDVPAYAQPNEIISKPYIAPQFNAPAESNSGLFDNSSFLSTYEAQTDDVDQEEIIDALVNEFMPKIEAKLRQRLKQTLAKTPLK